MSAKPLWEMTVDDVRAKLKKGYLVHVWRRTSPPNVWIRHPANGKHYDFEWRGAPIPWSDLEEIQRGPDIIAPALYTGQMANWGPEEKVYRLKKNRASTRTDTK